MRFCSNGEEFTLKYSWMSALGRETCVHQQGYGHITSCLLHSSSIWGVREALVQECKARIQLCCLWNELGSRQEWARAKNHSKCLRHKARGSAPGYEHLRPPLLSPTPEGKISSQGCGRVAYRIAYSRMQRGTGATSKNFYIHTD